MTVSIARSVKTLHWTGLAVGREEKLTACHLMRRLRGGPAYAANSASALFGTVSGSVGANVVAPERS